MVVVVGRMALERFRRPRLLLAILGALLSIALTDLTTNIIKVHHYIEFQSHSSL